LAALEGILAEAELELADVARTWFFNADILDWYGEFNRVRTAHYAHHAFRIGATPASTGVAGSNPAQAALVMGAWAVRGTQGRSCAWEVPSPLQGPAPAYGSSFSRAVEIRSGGLRRLLVSGTASIAPGGETLHSGEPLRQAALTLEVVGAILKSRAMGFGNVVRATAYVKHRHDAEALQAWFGSQVQLPCVWVNCDICREDLLFELELDACALA
jgi:enamine deaminase RidA (YjgF/YER057c/UK114 family)